MKKEISSLLRKRAALLARESEQIIHSSKLIEIEFTLAGECYGIESSFVREVFPLKDFTPLPGVPSHILGIVSVRGQIITIVDLRKFFNLPEKGLGELNKLIILQNGEIEFGILADGVIGEHPMAAEDIQEAPQTLSKIGAKYIKGVSKDQVIILNAKSILNDEGIIVDHKPR